MKKSQKTEALLNGEVSFCDITNVNYSELFSLCGENERIVIVGGGGTLNRFINDTAELERSHHIMYLAGGSGNDFTHDIGAKSYTFVELDKYIGGGMIPTPEQDRLGKDGKL